MGKKKKNNRTNNLKKVLLTGANASTNEQPTNDAKAASTKKQPANDAASGGALAEEDVKCVQEWDQITSHKKTIQTIEARNQEVGEKNKFLYQSHFKYVGFKSTNLYSPEFEDMERTLFHELGNHAYIPNDVKYVIIWRDTLNKQTIIILSVHSGCFCPVKFNQILGNYCDYNLNLNQELHPSPIVKQRHVDFTPKPWNTTVVGLIAPQENSTVSDKHATERRLLKEQHEEELLQVTNRHNQELLQVTNRHDQDVMELQDKHRKESEDEEKNKIQAQIEQLTQRMLQLSLPKNN